MVVRTGLVETRAVSRIYSPGSVVTVLVDSQFDFNAGDQKQIPSGKIGSVLQIQVENDATIITLLEIPGPSIGEANSKAISTQRLIAPATPSLTCADSTSFPPVWSE